MKCPAPSSPRRHVAPGGGGGGGGGGGLLVLAEVSVLLRDEEARVAATAAAGRVDVAAGVGRSDGGGCGEPLGALFGGVVRFHGSNFNFEPTLF